MKSTSLIIVKLYKILKENKDLFLTILAYYLSNMTSKFSYSLKCANIYSVFNLIQDRGGGGMGGGGQTIGFYPVTSTNARISPQNFLTFSFNPFDRLV